MGKKEEVLIEEHWLFIYVLISDADKLHIDLLQIQRKMQCHNHDPRF
jgi:hypothetical protein